MTTSKTSQTEQIKQIAIGNISIGEDREKKANFYKLLAEEGLAHVYQFLIHPSSKMPSNIESSNKEHFLSICNQEKNTPYYRSSTALIPYQAQLNEHLKPFSFFDKWIKKSQQQLLGMIDLDRCMQEQAIEKIDYLCFSIFGVEKEILEHSLSALTNVLVIELQAVVQPVFTGQWTFAEIDIFLKAQGFMCHKMQHIESASFNSTIAEIVDHSQHFLVELVYIKNFQQIEKLSIEQVMSLITILQQCYNSCDFVEYLLRLCDRLCMSECSSADNYVQFVQIDHHRKLLENNKLGANILLRDLLIEQQNLSCPIPVLPGRKLHIGGWQQCTDWEILDALPRDTVDHVCNAQNLSLFKENTFVGLYASHVLEHFDYKEELKKVLDEWFRVLSPGGYIYISVPDIGKIGALLLLKQISPEEKFRFMIMIYGGHSTEYDYHKVGFDRSILIHFLHQSKFTNIQFVDKLGLFKDISDLEFQEISLCINVIAQKPMDKS